MIDDIREQKLAQNCRTRDNFVRDWLHQLLYWVLSLLLVGSGAKFLPIEVRRFFLLGATLHIYSSCVAIIKMQQMQQNALEHTFCQSMPADSLSSAQQYTTHPSCLAIITMQQNAAEQSFCQSRPEDSVSSAQHLFLAIYIFP